MVNNYLKAIQKTSLPFSRLKLNGFSFKKHRFSYIFILFLFMGTNNTFAQTTLISPTTDGGFENGSTFASNGWTANTPAATNKSQWFCGPGATSGFNGTNCAYVTNDAGSAIPTHTYNLTLTCASHLYKDVTIPAAETTIELNFSWIGRGDTTLDRMRIWAVPNTYTPINGSAIAAGGGRVQVGLTNYSGQATWTNAATVTIPASFAGTTMRLVFEWFNNNSAGTQPPAAIDNISLVSIMPAGCIAPSAATGFTAGSITSSTFPATFSGSANGYLVIQSTSITPPSQPLNGTLYNAGNVSTLGSGLTFVQSSSATSISTTGLSGNTQYYYFIYAYNNTSCSGGPAYNASGPLTGSGITCPAVPNTVNTSSVTHNSFSLNWTTPTGGSASIISYTVEVCTDAGFTIPVSGSPFNVSGSPLNMTGLSANTTYYYRIVAKNSCSSSAVTGNVTTNLTPCTAPAQATGFTPGTITTSSIAATYSGSANGYLVIRSLTNTPPTQPVNGTLYSSLNVSSLGAGLTFIQTGSSTAIADSGLSSNTTYYYFIYAYNNSACSGGPTYNTSGALSGSATTLPSFNDNCTAAFPLTVNPTLTCTTSTSGTTVSATQSQAACAGTADDDVWYRFTATATSHIITVTPTTLSDAVFQVFSGTCGGTLTSLGCIDNTVGSAIETSTISGLTSGVTYYVRVHSYGNGSGQGTFSICVTTMPACTAPSAATGLTFGTPTATNITANFSGSANGYLVIQSTSSTPPAQPVNGTTYTAVNIGTLGPGLTFVQSNASTSISATGLTGNTRYYYYIYAYNNTSCSGGPIYNSTVLTGNIVTCAAAPSSVNTTNVSTNTFTINWGSSVGGNTNSVNYTLQITTDPGYTANIVGSPFTIAAPTSFYNVTGLSSSTIYYYRILASNGCASAYVTGNISTTCSPTNIPYTQNFDSVTQPNLPPCISIQNVNGDAQFWKTCNTTSLGNATAVTPNSGSNQMGIQYNSSNVMDDWFYIQGLNMTAGTAYRLTFYTRAYVFSGSNENIEVKCGTSPTAASMTQSILPSTTVPGNVGYTQKVIDFVVPSSGVYYIGFHGVSAANIWYLFVDDVSVTLSPSCLTPTVNAATNLTSTSATLNWNAPIVAPSNGYQYVVSASNTTPVGSGTAAAGLTANVTGLAANTTYYVFVRSDCGGGNYSSWSSPATFFTGYCSSTSTLTGYYISNFSTTGGTANITNNSSGLSASGYGNFTAMTVSQQPYGSVNFSSTYFGGSFGFNIWVDWNNDLDFDDPGEKVYASGNYNTSNTGSFTVPGSAAVGNHRMRIRANYYDTNPQVCGSITNGETEDYTFTVLALSCSGNPSNLTASGIGFTTATVSWTAASPAPASGYQYFYATSALDPIYSTAPSGSVGAGVTTVNLSSLTSGLVYYVWVRSNCGGTGQGVWSGPLSFSTIASPPVTTNSSVCQGGTTTISATGTCTGLTNLGNTINGGWDATTDPRAVRPLIFLANSPTCAFDPSNLTANYASMDFQVSTTGSYTFTMAPTTAYDSMGYIVINPFNPGVCGSGTWVVGDDDSGPTTFEPQMTATLTAGVTYTLISTLYAASSVLVTNTFQWNVTGPGTISGVIGGSVEWYTAASGGVPIGTGTPFNPVGVAGSGLTNTSTPGTYTFYAACPNNPNVRSAANFVITGPTATISGSGTTCAGGTLMTINLTGTGPWNFTYTDGTTPVTVTGNMTNPYTFTVNPSTPKTYTLTALSDANCTALASNLSGSGTVSSSKTWNGSSSGNWNLASNWSPSGIPTATDCVTIPPSANPPVISGTGYQAFAYNLTVLSGGILTINSSNYITVTDAVNVNSGGQFLIKNEASLIQTNNVNNSGVVNIERVTQPMYRFDYTYWGCPVTLASNYTLGMLSPNTQPDKFYSWIPTTGANQFGTWQQESTATVMNPIKGYIVRAPQTFSYTPDVKVTYTANFIGTPNNGNISCPIYHGSLVANNNDKYNLLGNPYPSAVDAQAFLTDLSNAAVIDGTIYFWTHNSGPSTAYVDPFYGDYVINYNGSDYASWNSLGPVGSRGSAATTGGSVPNGYIACGQGFFTRSTGSAPSGNSVVFKNSMRSSINNQFYRMPSIVQSERQYRTADTAEKHRIWVNMISDGGVFNQILVGYIQGATTGWDRAYDGVRLTDGNSSTFYSIIPEQNLVIQGRPLPFDVNDQIPLGFKTTVQDHFSIRLDQFDGLFENQDIFIEDKLLNITHNLKLSPYQFNANSGTFDDRFVLRFTDSALGVNNNDNQNLFATIHQKHLQISAPENINLVEIFDMTGKLITTYKPSAATKILNELFLYADGFYLSKIYLNNGAVVAKKLNHKKSE